MNQDTHHHHFLSHHFPYLSPLFHCHLQPQIQILILHLPFQNCLPFLYHILLCHFWQPGERGKIFFRFCFHWDHNEKASKTQVFNSNKLTSGLVFSTSGFSTSVSAVGLDLESRKIYNWLINFSRMVYFRKMSCLKKRHFILTHFQRPILLKIFYF